MAVNVTVDDGKQEIIRRFNDYVRGRKPETTDANTRHDGKDGHWLERQMGVKANRSNDPDLFGYEMKNHTTGKTTFGDWSADYYIFKDGIYSLARDQFLAVFGKPNLAKKGRCSWSGEPCPKIGFFNTFGQKLMVDNDNNIVAVYCFSKDLRQDKLQIAPAPLQQENLVLAKWYMQSIKQKLDNKFNQNGWFKCLKNQQGVYESLVFGDPINFESWIALVKTGEVFFDSGMYQTNARNYSQWRANNSFWDGLITSRY